jgi:predicted S18 family serine protease
VAVRDPEGREAAEQGQEEEAEEEEPVMAYVGFKKLAAKTSPAVAASIGRKKYGKKKFQKAAAQGKKMRGVKPKGKR